MNSMKRILSALDGWLHWLESSLDPDLPARYWDYRLRFCTWLEADQ